MAKKRLKIKDKQGNVVDYDISAASVTIDVEGKSLDVKLSELVDAIARSVKSVTFNGNSPTMDSNGNVNLGQQVQPDWKEGNINWPSYIKNKPSFSRVATTGSYNDLTDKPTIPEGVATDSQMSDSSDAPVKNRVIKAYVDNLISGLINGAPQALDTLNELSAALGNDANFAATITQQLAGKISGIKKHDGTPIAPDENGIVTLPESEAGAQGPKGDTGNVEFEGLDDLIALLVNDLTTGGAGNFLSAEMGKRLKEQVDYVYGRVQAMFSLFSNAAFWAGKPQQSALLPDLDWSNPKHTITLGLSLTNAVVKRNGVAVSNGETIQAEEFSTLTFIVEPSSSSFALTSVTSSTTGATVTDNGNGTYTVAFAVGQSDATLAITAVAAAARTITYNLTHCDATTKPTSVLDGGSATIVLQADTDYTMPTSLPSGAVTNASVTSYTRDANDDTKATLVIGNVTGNVTIALTLTGEYIDGGDLVAFWDGLEKGSTANAWTDKIGGVVFSNDGATSITKGWSFDGSSGGLKNNDSLNWPAASYTIEVAFKSIGSSATRAVFHQKTDGGIGLGLWPAGYPANAVTIVCSGNSAGKVNYVHAMSNQSFVGVASANVNLMLANGSEATKASESSLGTGTINSIGGRWDTTGGSAAWRHVLNGEIYAIRIYKRQLTEQEMLHNQEIDNERYELGLTLSE